MSLVEASQAVSRVETYFPVPARCLPEGRRIRGILCPSCGVSNLPEYRFCLRCGADLAAVRVRSALGSGSTGHHGPTAAVPPLSPGSRSAGRKRLTVLVVCLVSAALVLVVIAADLILRQQATMSQPNPLPPSSGYGVYLFVDEVTRPSTLAGRAPANGYWLQVYITARNTGPTPLSLTYRDWEARDASGLFSATPVQSLYGSETLYPSQYTTYWLRFDLNAAFQPDRIVLALANGHELGVPLVGGPRRLGILVGRSGDGTNWTMTITSRPAGLTATGLSALTYSTVRVAYVPAGNGTYVSVADRLLFDTIAYPAGYSYRISDSTTELVNGTFSG